ncbi:hypothetical protein ScPMuIL_010081 [Solemya velum]
MFTSPAHGIARGRALNSALSYVRCQMDGMNSESAECICDRTRQKILCRSCGQTFTGRVRRRCSSHPNEIHLMDFEMCPYCKAPCTQLKEFGDLKKN